MGDSFVGFIQVVTNQFEGAVVTAIHFGSMRILTREEVKVSCVAVLAVWACPNKILGERRGRRGREEGAEKGGRGEGAEKGGREEERKGGREKKINQTIAVASV